MPLEAVGTDLKCHVAAFKGELVEVINGDCNDFVNLCTKLVDVDGAVLRMRVPLFSDLRAHLLSVHEGVAAAPVAVEDGSALWPTGSTSSTMQQSTRTTA